MDRTARPSPSTVSASAQVVVALPSEAELVKRLSSHSSGGVLKALKDSDMSVDVSDFLDELQPGLTKAEGFGDDGISLVVPHQASGLALDILSTQFGIPRERVMRNVLETAGNTIAASTPLVLYEAVSSGRARRGDEILLLGTGAGLSMAGIILVY